MVSHDLNLAAEHCDRLLLLADGRAQALGTPEEVINPQQLEQAYGCPVNIDVDPVSRRPRVRSSLVRLGADSSGMDSPRM
jgi:iron complex transport system ATP-binding protein